MKLRVLALSLLVAGAITVSTASPAGAATQVTVTPGTDLIDLQDVQVEASGFAPGLLVGACQTFEGAHQEADCATGTVTISESSAEGRASLTVSVRRFAEIPSLGRTIDCADPAARCTISVADVFDIEATQAAQRITFVLPPPPPQTRGSISVSPDEGLIHGDVVTVAGTGFRPAVEVVVEQCVAEPVSTNDCSGLNRTVATTDAAGSFSTTLEVRRELGLLRNRPYTDCAMRPCTVAVDERIDFAGTVVTVPLGFEPPAGPPAITVTPDRGVRPGDVVTVSGVNFVPNAVVSAEQCLWDGRCFPAATTEPADDGSFAVPLTLVHPEVGCEEPGACRVVVRQPDPLEIQLEALLDFDFVPPPVVVPGGATVEEGHDGTTTELHVPVTLSAPSDRTVTVAWRTVYDPTWSELAAVPGLDHAAASGVVTFAPGATEASVAVAVIGDELPEPDELLVVSFHDPTNARMGGWWGLGFGAIVDDDG